jgi:flagellar motility protein MotE (MotC chaperone)
MPEATELPKSIFRFRLLPVTLFAASLMLTVKISGIWQGVDGLFDGSVMAAETQAETAAPPKPAADEATTDEPEADAPASGEDSVAETAPAEEPVESKLSASEIELLQQLSGRRETLEVRERAAEKQQALLKAAEARIDQKVRELKSMQATIERLIETYDEQQEAKIRSLVKIYENMKPKDAARIFEKLDMETLLLVAERMKERKLAPIMAKMDPNKAKDITEELAQLRQVLPASAPPAKQSGRG